MTPLKVRPKHSDLIPTLQSSAAHQQTCREQVQGPVTAPVKKGCVRPREAQPSAETGGQLQNAKPIDVELHVWAV